MTDTLQSRFFAQAERHPERRSLGFYSAEGHVTWLSCGDVHQSALEAGGWLSDQGLGRGDVCVLVLPSGRHCAMLLLGALALGAIPLVVAPPAIQGSSSNQAGVLLRVIRRTRATLVVADDSLEAAHEGFGRLKGRMRYLPPDGTVPPANPAGLVRPGAHDLAAYQLTSGTTGMPRVCVWRQRSVIAALDCMRLAMRLNGDDICLNWTPLYHDMGLVNNFFLCVTTGTPLVLLSPLDFVQRPAIWLQALSATGATLTWSPNFGFALAAERVRDDEIEGVRLDSVRAFWNAAERIHLETVLAFHERFHPLGVELAALKTNFGCAENIGGATFSDVDASFVVERVQGTSLYREGVAVPVPEEQKGDVVSVVSAGRPSPGITVRILDRQGKQLPDGRVGEVALETPSRMEGYLADARSTARAIRGNLLMTGDLGYVRGEEFFWTGRVRERITVRGRKLDPSDFEPVLLNVSGLRRGCFVAFGVDDSARGTQKVVVAAELRNESTDARRITKEIRERVLRQLGVTLSDVVLVPKGSLVKTTSGKRRHRAYGELYSDGTLNELRVRSTK